MDYEGEARSLELPAKTETALLQRPWHKERTLDEQRELQLKSQRVSLPVKLVAS